ncbi:MAG: lipase family protein [Actinomycetota bacterium]|nr:lipase family protein [Actinomycetota bacterium]
MLAVAVTMLLAVAGLPLSIPPAVASTPVGSFYRPPSPLRAGEPGDVIRAESMSFGFDPSVSAWRVLYRSTTAPGKPTAVSGIVLVPKAPWRTGLRPIVAYAVGTHGMGDQCAPSKWMGQGSDPEATLVKNLLNRGWAVAVTDYPGLGTPGDHHYAVGTSLGRSVLDSLRAAVRLPDARLDPGAPMAVTGYSEGGGAAAWAAQLHASYAPELAVKGVAAGGVPADLPRVLAHLDGGPFVGFVLAGGVGFKAAYPELPLHEYLTSAGKQAAADIADDCREAMVAKTAFRRVSDYTTTDLANLPPWRARLVENNLGGSAPQMPLFLYHAVSDQLIPYEVGRDLRLTYCAKRVTVQWKDYVLSGHSAAAAEAAPDVANFIQGRLLGLPPPNNC